jgi:desulfoferrodoxin-like iron-binding protein
MGVLAKGERYHCEICGNEVVVEEVGGGTLSCCGQEMTLIDKK